MANVNLLNKDNYFDEFSNLINKLKKNESVEIQVLENFYKNIENITDLTFQDIITYMLYCFEVIELTQKWKLKKLINYDFFLNSMEEIYDEIFCAQKSKFNNKIIAATSFGNIIEKTINYDIENKIEKILQLYLKCIGTKRAYLKNNDLVLLRGNLYCQIYNVIKNNLDINEFYKNYLDKMNDVFDYQKYIKNAEFFYNNILAEKNLSYFELNNFLLFNTYNDCIIKDIDIKKIFSLLLKKYPQEYFDKKIYIYLIRNFATNIINDKNIKINLEFVFETKNDEENVIFVNYNLIDYNFCNNLDIIKDVYCRLNKLASSYNNSYFELLKVKDELIAHKEVENNSILNYQTITDYKSLLEFNNYLGKREDNNFYAYIIKLIKRLNNDENKMFSDEPLTNDEIFRKLYNSDDIKELLKTYPILELEYDSNGNYKNIAELMYEKIELGKKTNDKTKEQIKTYEMLINYRDADIYSLLNDYYSLLIIDSTDSTLIKEKEEILKNVLPNLIEQKILLCGQISKETSDEIYKEYINPCIKKISQNRVNKKKFSSTKDFLNYEKSNSDNYFGICKLQDLLKDFSN